jgi:hypothetical protein
MLFDVLIVICRSFTRSLLAYIQRTSVLLSCIHVIQLMHCFVTEASANAASDSNIQQRISNRALPNLEVKRRDLLTAVLYTLESYSSSVQSTLRCSAVCLS